MTKQEFDEKFTSSYQSVLRSAETKELVNQVLQSASAESGKISQKAITESFFSILLKLNQRILRSVLLSVLEFDD